VTLRTFVLFNGFFFEFIKLEFGEKDVVGNVIRASKSASVLVVGEDGLEARSMSVEEQFLSLGVVELASSNDVPEQRQRVTVEHSASAGDGQAASVGDGRALSVSG